MHLLHKVGIVGDLEMPAAMGQGGTLQWVAWAGGLCNAVLSTSVTRWSSWGGSGQGVVRPAALPCPAGESDGAICSPSSCSPPISTWGSPLPQARMSWAHHTKPGGSLRERVMLCNSSLFLTELHGNWGATNGYGPTPLLDGLPLFYLTSFQEPTLGSCWTVAVTASPSPPRPMPSWWRPPRRGLWV